ncbi:MAG: hypothetical protein DLM68_12420 [Hyphomicrobiales bacterium]|nr:MAG: hypothetical protein DLM68_12420 [Hyphomicrobiales bacterium]
MIFEQTSILLAKLTPAMRSGNRPAHRRAAAADRKMHLIIDQSYQLKDGAAIFGLGRFFAPIGQKCFT